MNRERPSRPFKYRARWGRCRPGTRLPRHPVWSSPTHWAASSRPSANGLADKGLSSTGKTDGPQRQQAAIVSWSACSLPVMQRKAA